MSDDTRHLARGGRQLNQRPCGGRAVATAFKRWESGIGTLHFAVAVRCVREAAGADGEIVLADGEITESGSGAGRLFIKCPRLVKHIANGVGTSAEL